MLYIIIFVDRFCRKIWCLLSKLKLIFLAGIVGASQFFNLPIEETVIAAKLFPVRLSKNVAIIVSSMNLQC